MCLLEQYAHQILHQLYLKLKVMGLLSQVPNIDYENTFCVCAFFKKMEANLYVLWVIQSLFCYRSSIIHIWHLGLTSDNVFLLSTYLIGLQYRQLFSMFAFSLSKQRTGMIMRKEKEKQAIYRSYLEEKDI